MTISSGIYCTDKSGQVMGTQQAAKHHVYIFYIFSAISTTSLHLFYHFYNPSFLYNDSFLFTLLHNYACLFYLVNLLIVFLFLYKHVDTHRHCWWLCCGCDCIPMRALLHCTCICICTISLSYSCIVCSFSIPIRVQVLNESYISTHVHGYSQSCMYITVHVYLCTYLHGSGIGNWIYMYN